MVDIGNTLNNLNTNAQAAAAGAVGNAQAAVAGVVGDAQAAAAAAAAAATEKLEKAKEAAEKLKALKDRLKRKKQSAPKLPPVPKYEPKPLPKEEIVKFKDSPPPPAEPLDRNGYTYLIKNIGPKNQIIVYNNTNEIYRGIPSFTASVDILLEEALTVLTNANNGTQLLYPNIRNLIRKVDK